MILIINHSKTIRSVISLLCSSYGILSTVGNINNTYRFTVIYRTLLQLVSVLFIDMLWSLL